MKYFFIFFLLLGNVIIVSAQGRIQGKVIDKISGTPLGGSSIILLSPNRSETVFKQTADEKGNYKFDHIPKGQYLLSIKYLGFDSASFHILIRDLRSEITQNVELNRNSIKLSAVNISTSKPLVSFKSDTIVYNADQIRTTENADLKQLLGKIPGIYIDQNGDYYFQGAKISDITIDGKKSFQQSSEGSADPKKIEELLRANMIDKIEISNKRNINGRRVVGADKTINLVLKEAARKRITGKALAGLGTDDTYNLFANVNKFDSNRQIIVAVRSNNANIFGNGDIRPVIDIVPGRSTIINGDANLNTEIGSKIKLNAMINGGIINSSLQRKTERQNFLTDSSFFYNSSESSKRNEKFFMANLFTDINISDKDHLNVGIMFNRRHAESDANSNFLTHSLIGDTIDAGNIRNNESSLQTLGEINAQYRRTVGKLYGGFSTTIRYSFKLENSDQINYSVSNGGIGNLVTLNKYLQPNNNGNGIDFSAQYSLPIDSGIFFSIEYNMKYNRDQSNQVAHDYDTQRKGYYLPIDSLTYRFNGTSTNHAVRSGVFIMKGRFIGQVGLSYNAIDASNQNFSTRQRYSSGVNFFAPSIGVEYRISPKSTIRTAFENRANPIPISQLMPINNLKNPNFIQLGNPDLAVGRSTTASINLNGMNKTGFNYHIDINGMFQDKAVTNSIHTDSIGRQVSIPINVNGIYNVSIIAGVGARVLKSITVNYDGMYEKRNSISFLNDVKNSTNQYIIRSNFTSAYTYQKLDIHSVLSVIYSASRYSSQNNHLFDYIMYNCTFSAGYELPLGLAIGSSVSYNQNTSANQKYVLLNSWLSKSFLRSRSLEAKVFAYDVLRQNQSIFINQAANYREITVTNVLPQYFMITLSYYIGKNKEATQNQFLY